MLPLQEGKVKRKKEKVKMKKENGIKGVMTLEIMRDQAGITDI